MASLTCISSRRARIFRGKKLSGWGIKEGNWGRGGGCTKFTVAGMGTVGKFGTADTMGTDNAGTVGMAVTVGIAVTVGTGWVGKGILRGIWAVGVCIIAVIMGCSTGRSPEKWYNFQTKSTYVSN